MVVRSKSLIMWYGFFTLLWCFVERSYGEESLTKIANKYLMAGQNSVRQGNDADPIRGGCKWVGSAPLCEGECPDDYTHVRSHTGRCGNKLSDKNCIPDHTFGLSCFPDFMGYHTKKYCCKIDSTSCDINGTFIDSLSATVYTCGTTLDFKNEQCGKSVLCKSVKKSGEAQLQGPKCTQFKLFGYKVTYGCGFIVFYNQYNEAVNIWYKDSKN